MSNDHWLARIELAEARALAGEAERDRYREALRRIVHGGPHDPQYIALDALDSTDQGDDA